MALFSNATGKMGAFTTGCGGSSCHGGSANALSSISMSFDGDNTITSYVPGRKYTVELSISNGNFAGNSSAKAGFDLNINKGTITNAPAGTMLMGTELHHTTPKALDNNAEALFTFDWTAPAAGSGSATINIAANVVNGNTTATGDEWNLKTITLTEGSATPKATVTSVSSGSITTTSAVISAQINAQGSATTAVVEYGTTTSYGSQQNMSPASITGTTNTAASATLSGLTSNTTYNYRIKATNAGGELLTTNGTFTTSGSGSSSLKPSISTITSSSITNTSASINAQINAQGSSTTAEIQYGTTTSYGLTKSMTPASITGTTNTAATASLTGLSANTTYNYRIKATNANGDSISANGTFKTTNTGAAIFSGEAVEIAIYPNPSADYVIISLKNAAAVKAIGVYTVLGKEISLPVIHQNNSEIKLNTNGLSKGLYYIRLNTGSEMKAWPLVIEK